MTDKFWRKIERFLKAQTLIPVLGPGVITFGEDDQLLRPWLVREVADELGLDGAFPGLHEVVCAHLRARGSIEDVCLTVDELVESPMLQPGTLLRDLAGISQCQLFFTLTFDPLFEHALNEVRGAGHPVVRAWSFSLDSTVEDLPRAASAPTMLGYLFGKASANPGFHLWDADAVEFVYQFQRLLPMLNNLGRTLAENNFLFIGTQLSDWMVRFLFRAFRQGPLTGGAGKNLLLADNLAPGSSDAVIFYDSLNRGIEVLETEPIPFAREFCRRAFQSQPRLKAGTVPGTTLAFPLMERVAPAGCILVSYVRKDAEPVFRLVEKLRAAGCLVWLDVRILVCGDNFDSDLEDIVKKHCGFFVSVISRTTESLAESYCLKERNWAAMRSASMAEGRPFYFPVVIDGTPLPPCNEPRAFASIHADRATAGEVSDAFVARIAELQQLLLHPPA
jgi:hypothetical protein